MSSRRHFVVTVMRSAFPLWLIQDAAPIRTLGQDTAQHRVADPLRDPDIVQRRDSLTAADNDPMIVGVERKLHCTCGCTLDIYTCRTTDFSCTFSPALHRRIATMIRDGRTPQQVIDAFVAEEGEKILMSPPPKGFNLAGYLVPALVVSSAALGLVGWVSHRRRGRNVGGHLVPSSAPLHDAPAADQVERLQRALDEIDS